MMRELVVCTKQVEGEEGDAVRYRYSILIDEMDVGPFSCESYGGKDRPGANRAIGRCGPCDHQHPQD